MSTFTKGPWRVYRTPNHDMDAIVDIIGVTTASDEHADSDGDGADICEMQNQGYFGASQVEANADLISAAPDMYEALRALLAAVEGTAGGHLAADVLEGAVVNGARAALAKATGESP